MKDMKTFWFQLKDHEFMMVVFQFFRVEFMRKMLQTHQEWYGYQDALVKILGERLGNENEVLQ